MTVELVWNEDLRVKTFECDFAARWKPAHILQTMTEAASAHAAHLGVGFEALAEQNLVWVLSRVKIVIREAPRVGEALRLRTWPKGLQQKLFFMRDFLLDGADGGPRIAASTAWLLVDPRTRRLALPQALKTALPQPAGLVALDEPLEKIAADGALSERLTRTPGYSAVDLLGHTNSARYLEWTSDCFALEDYQKNYPAWLQVNFLTEVRAGELVSLSAGAAAGAEAVTHVVGTNRTTGARAFEAAVGW